MFQLMPKCLQNILVNTILTFSYSPESNDLAIETRVEPP